jgi:hypothetical protein
MTWGVVVHKKRNNEQRMNLNIQIIKKKIRGFVKSNQIQFPLVIDRFNIFNGFMGEGTTLLFFDSDNQSVKKYVFPLNDKQKKEILSFLRN